MRLLIHDANVLIDLLDINLLDEAMALPCTMETTDLVQHEVVEFEQAQALSSCIDKRLLTVLSSSIEQLAAIGKIQHENPRLTLADCSVVFHARERHGMVLSGDGPVRKEAERQQLEVHSTPWLFSRMVAESIIDMGTAVEKLEILMSINKRLPHRECLKLIESWRKSV